MDNSKKCKDFVSDKDDTQDIMESVRESKEKLAEADIIEITAFNSKASIQTGFTVSIYCDADKMKAAQVREHVNKLLEYLAKSVQELENEGTK